VRVTVERTDGTRVKFTQMSEGEQQLMTVLGLLLFTQNDESLYLLDEPDTHLNPVWTYDYLNLLQQNIRAEKGQLIIATHNPLMIGSLHRNQVRILAQEDNRIVSSEPEYDFRPGLPESEHWQGLATEYADLATFASDSSAELRAGIYVIDPWGQLVLFYRYEDAGQPVLDDLKRLLKASRIG
jgi:ABC-type multidrug transport system ATPase subunit